MTLPRLSDIPTALAWWWSSREPTYPRYGTAGMIASAGLAFSASIRAATGAAPRGPRTQAEKVRAIEALFMDDAISVTSLDIELSHLPGGLPAIEDE